jgi:hypothetical protein
MKTLVLPLFFLSTLAAVGNLSAAPTDDTPTAQKLPLDHGPRAQVTPSVREQRRQAQLAVAKQDETGKQTAAGSK